MTFAQVANNTITAEQGRPPQSARRLDNGNWVMNLRDADAKTQEACGWFAVIDVPRPADTDTTTADRSVVIVAGKPTVKWTTRTLTDDEVFARQQAAAPDATTALIARITADDVPALWKQPTGAHDAYLPGAIALDAKGDRWRNDLGTANVWPFDNLHAKWTNLDATVPVGPQPWKPWDGIGPTYKVGDPVTFEGKTYESVIANNTWSPSAYPAGWKLIA